MSPDSRWVAYITVPRSSQDREELVLVPVRGGARRLLLRSRSVTDLRFSPDSRHLAAVLRGRRVRVYDIAADTTIDTARGHIRGYSFSPDGTQLAFGVATGASVGASSDIYVAPLDRSVERRRITTTGDALNPVWGPQEVVFDRQRRRRGQPPAYNLWATDPSGTAPPRRLTSLTIPPLFSGLVPLELSADGRRLLAVFTGQDAGVGFTVDARSRAARARSRATSRAGSSASTSRRTAARSSPTPAAPTRRGRTTSCALPYGGGEPTVLVENAAFPDWSR